MIFDILRETSALLKEIKSFGHGPRSYANLEQENEAMEKYGWGVEFTRAWCYPVESNDQFLPNGAFDRSYKVMLDIQDKCDIDASSAELEQILRTLDVVATQFILQLKKSAKVRNIGKVFRAPVYHYTDTNLTGYMLNFDIQIKEEIVYPCP